MQSQAILPKIRVLKPHETKDTKKHTLHMLLNLLSCALSGVVNKPRKT